MPSMSFAAALETAMDEQIRAIVAITGNAAEPDFENTIVALERSGARLNRVATIYGIWSSLMSTDEFRQIEEKLAPRLAAHGQPGWGSVARRKSRRGPHSRR